MPTVEITNLISVAEGQLLPGRRIEITNPLLPPAPPSPPAGAAGQGVHKEAAARKRRRRRTTTSGKAISGPAAHKAIMAPAQNKS